MIDIQEVRTDFRRELRSAAWADEILEQLPRVTRRASAAGDQDCVTAFDLDEATADDKIQEQIGHYARLGRPFEWKVFSFDSPPDLAERLRTAGFEVGDREAVVIYALAEGLAPLEGEFPCDVLRVDSAARLADFRFVAETVFAKDYAFTTRQLEEALAAGRSGHEAYIAYVDDEPASVGRLYTDPNSRFAGLYGGGTRTEFRGRGCYRAIVSARARAAVARGARYLQVDALPTSRPILERIGFVRIADTRPCTYDVKRSCP